MMKKIRFYVGLLLLGMMVATGCSNEENLEQVLDNGKTVQAVIESVSKSRTSVNDEYKVLWTVGDAFTVFENSEKKATLTLTDGGGTTSGKFSIDNNVTLTESMVALFPASESLEYTFEESYSSQETDAPMLGSYDGSKFTFNLLTAMVRVVVADVPVGDISFTISSKNNEILTGKAELNDANKLNVPETGETSVSVGFKTDEVKTLTFDVPVPVQNYTSGLQVVVKSGNQEVLNKATNGFNAEAGKLYLFGATSVIVTDVIDANEKLANDEITAVKVQSVAAGDVITIPARETSADVEHTIDLSAATLPTSGTVSISVDNTEESTTVKNLTVIVPEGTSASSLNINAPGTTVTITAETVTEIAKIEATTADNTLIIDKGVSVKELVVNAGNVKIEGGKIVTSIANTQNKEIVYVIADNADLGVYQALNQEIKDAITKIECTLDEFVEVKSAAELYAASKGAKNIKLGANITIDANKPVNPSNGQTYDLGDKTVDVATTGSKDVFRIEEANAVVTIKNGTIDNQTGNNYALSIRADGVTLNMEGVTIPANNYDGSLHKNGNYTGSVITLTNCTFNGVVYLSNTDAKTPNTLTVSGGSFTSAKQNCFDLLNTNATISDATLTNNVSEQSYQVNGNEGNNFSKPLGYCIALKNTDGVAAKGSATLSGNTYTISDADGCYIFNQLNGATLDMEVSRFKEFAAVAAAGGEIKLLNDITDAVGLSINKALTVDFNGKTYTIGKPGTGSEGTETLGLQLLENNTIIFKNGTINCDESNKNESWESSATAKGIAMMVQNYANLTLQDMNIDGTNIAHNGSNMRYVVSNNSGTVKIEGSTSITAIDKDVAFDVCKYRNYAAPEVTVNTTGTINGLVEVSGGTLNVTAGTFKNEGGHCVKVVTGIANFNGGEFTAKEVAVFNMAGAVKIEGGEFTSNDNAVISGNGTNDDKYKNGNIEITGGTFNAKITSAGYVACGIYHPQKGTLKVTGGTFNIENGCGILMRGGELEMTNSTATFTFTGNAAEGTTGKVGDSRVVVPCGKKIVKDVSSNYYDAGNIKIEGVEDSYIYTVPNN